MKDAGKWDHFFKRHVENAQKEGKDLNESVEDDWGGTVDWAEKFINPFIPCDNATFCEVGPGTGRHSRLYIGQAKKYYLADYSDYVLEMLKDYFKKEPYAVYIKTNSSKLVGIQDGECDFVFSIGVFVHLYIEQFFGYIQEFYRVLRQGGRAVIHFANFMDDGGYSFFLETLPKNLDNKSVFRFYHPEMIQKMAEKSGFTVLDLKKIEGYRHCFIVLEK